MNPVAVTVGVGETVVLDPVVLSSSALYLPVVSNNAAKASAASVEEERWLFLPALVR